jgi:hypothetical protein
MKVGDLVRYKGDKIVMIAEGPNEVGSIRILLPDGTTSWIGNIRILLPDGTTNWVHTSDVRLMPKVEAYQPVCWKHSLVNKL